MTNLPAALRSIRWQADVLATADTGDEIVRYQDGAVRKKSGARGVNDRDMGHRQDVRCRGGL